MYEKLSEADIQFMEFFHDPVAMIENLIPENIDAPATWDENCKCVTLRPYQFAMVSYEYLYADDFDLDDKANFQKKINAGKLFNLAGRNIGKTYVGLDSDFPLTIIHGEGDESCLASFDADHLNPRVDRVANIIEDHPFFDIYKLKGKKQTVNRNSGITTRNGHVMRKANERVEGNRKGQKYHGMHYKKHGYDEFSYSTPEGEEKRIDSKHSFGVIERLFGITDVRVGSPLGVVLGNEANRNFICRLPQYVREDWDKQARKEAEEKYKGRLSPSFKLNVEAEIIAGAYSKFDIERIKRKAYNTEKEIINFEVDKENFEDFEKLLVIERLPCKKVFISSDIGTTGSPSEIIIVFDFGEKLQYRYQISLFKLIAKEQAQIFKWLYDKLGGAFISLDCTNADGRDIRQYLLDMGIPQEYLSDFRMNRKIEVGFQTNEHGQVLTDDKRKPLIKEENTKEFAIQLLEKLLYSGKIEIPIDHKFLNEFSNFFERKSGKHVSWGTSTTDHLLDSFLLFALCEWENRTKDIKNQKRGKRCLGVID